MEEARDHRLKDKVKAQANIQRESYLQRTEENQQTRINLPLKLRIGNSQQSAGILK